MRHDSHPQPIGIVIPLALLTGLTGCMTAPKQSQPPPPIAAIENLTAGGGFHVRVPEFVAHPEPSRFSICYGNTCAKRATVSLSSEEWRQVRLLFAPAAPVAAQERAAIAHAVALLEQIVGTKTGTHQDLPMDVPGFGKPGQLDCIDEATNTTVYLTLLYNDALLRWHTVGGRATRGPFTGLVTSWPHSTSVVRDISSGEQYAVDSWFLANGEPPYIVPMSVWWSGWRPDAAPP